MGADMTKAKEFVEQIQSKLSKVARREQLLIQALGDALGHADRQLLDDVRTLTIEHETRRTMILGELQALATRLGTFPAAEHALDGIEYEALDRPYEPYDEELEDVETGADAFAARGDWRQALENIRSGNGLPINGIRRVS